MTKPTIKNEEKEKDLPTDQTRPKSTNDFFYTPPKPSKTKRFFTHPTTKWWGDHEGELNYIVGVSALSLYSAYYHVPQKSHIGLTVGWNYLDAIFAWVAAKAIHEEREFNYRYENRDKWKMYLSIFSGLELLLFSWKIPTFIPIPSSFAASTPLAAIAFAVAMLVDFINAGIDWELARKKSDFPGWLEETEKEINFLAQTIVDKHYADENPYEGIAKLEELLKDFHIRCAANSSAHKTIIDATCKKLNTLTIKTKESNPAVTGEEINNFPKLLEQLRKKPDAPSTDDTRFILFDPDNPAPINYRKNEQSISDTLAEDLQTKKTVLAFKTASVIGMSCLAVPATMGVLHTPTIPGTNITAGSPLFFGTIFVSAAAIFYLYQFACAGAEKGEQLFTEVEPGT